MSLSSVSHHMTHLIQHDLDLAQRSLEHVASLLGITLDGVLRCRGEEDDEMREEGGSYMRGDIYASRRGGGSGQVVSGRFLPAEERMTGSVSLHKLRASMNTPRVLEEMFTSLSEPT